MTALANAHDSWRFPVIVKPRRGSDSLGVRLLRRGPIPARLQTAGYIVQEHVRGSELTVAVLQGRAGVPLQINLPEGAPYSFFRKYVLRPARTPLADVRLSARVGEFAARVAAVFGVNWAARIDMIHDTASGRLCFLECDVAPLVCVGSLFAVSLDAAGIGRTEQWSMLMGQAEARPI
jgi:D-alanine-D-alanine ligase-like ATP-grasp enzyme